MTAPAGLNDGWKAVDTRNFRAAFQRVRYIGTINETGTRRNPGGRTAASGIFLETPAINKPSV